MVRGSLKYLVGAHLIVLSGCAQLPIRDRPVPRDQGLRLAQFESETLSTETNLPIQSPLPLEKPVELAGPLPVEVLIDRALHENRTVRAAVHNVNSLQYRIPQVTTLDDPVASNTLFPIPSVGPQYSLMGYNPYNLTLAQQFPWFGTLTLQGEVASGDVKVALAELAAAQLDTIEAVKRAYFTLYAALKTDEILSENREILEDFLAVAQERLSTGGTQQDVIRAETMISELDRNRAENQVAVASARAALARQVHAHPATEFRTLGELPASGAPTEFDRLYELAVRARPELTGRFAAVDRDTAAVELARKRFYPNLTLGLTYMDMEKNNAMSLTAAGMPNIGLVVAFNLPVHRAKYQAGVCEARERSLADSMLYEAQSDETAAQIQDALVQVKTQQGVLALLRDSIAPRTLDAFDLARSDYAKANVDYGTVQSALREKLQVSLQIAMVEAELGRAIATLERAVGCELANSDALGSLTNLPALAPEPEHPPASGHADPINIRQDKPD